MNLKYLIAGAAAALSLTLASAPAQAFILGAAGGSGATMFLNGGPPGGVTLLSDYDPASVAAHPLDDSQWIANVGAYNSLGFHQTWDTTYLTARPNDQALIDLQLGAAGYNSFFAFDLTGLAHITSASISLYNTYWTDPDWLRLGRYTGDVETLRNGTGGTAAYDDLASGDLYAYEYVDHTAWIGIDLGAEFVTDFNLAIDAGDDYFVLGGTLETPPGAGPIPEPTTWAMMILGFLGAGAVLRSRRRTAAAV